MATTPEIQLAIKKPRQIPRVNLFVLFFVVGTSFFLFSSSFSDIQSLRHRHRRKRLHSLILRYPNLEEDTASGQLDAILQRVNGTLLANPTTTKPFILYRAIGNDLPPRHAHGQAYENVKFMLQHENRFEDLEVRWYLNRILNQSELLRIVQLLVDHKQTFSVDKFDLKEFNEQADVHLFGFKPVDVLRANFFYRNDSLSGHARREIRDRIFSPMNHFIVHNNQARNKMIALGIKTGARYILPWDGNCFLTETAWKNISESVKYLDGDYDWEAYKEKAEGIQHVNQLNRYKNTKRLSSKYFYVPMVRITDNAELLHKSYIPSSIDEEPQIIFRRDAHLRFNESLAYGCRPKVQLLWRLRVSGWWQKRYMHPSSCMTYNRKLQRHDVPLNMRVAATGWVARLFSGVAHLEVDGAIMLRGGSRSDAIEAAAARAVTMVSELEFNLTRDVPVFYDLRALNANLERYMRGEVEVVRLVNKLIDAADDIHQHLDEGSSDGTGDGVDDEVDEVDDNDFGALNKRQKSTGVERLRDARNLGILTLAALFSGEQRRMKYAVKWAHDLFSNLSPFDARLGIEGGVDLCVALDSIRLIQLSPLGRILTEDMSESVERWVKKRSWILTNSTLTIDNFYGSTWRSTLHDVHASCVALYSGDGVELLKHVSLARGRMLSQFRETSSIWRDGVRGLLAWVLLGQVNRRTLSMDMINIWSFNDDGFHVAYLPNATKSIVPLALDAINKRVELNIHGGLNGLHSSVDGPAEELCAVSAITLITEHVLKTHQGQDLWSEEFGQFEGVRKQKRPGEIPRQMLDADPCVGDKENFVPPFWNLGL